MRRYELAFITILLLFAGGMRLVGIAYGQPNMALHPSDAVRNFLPLEAPIHPDEYFYVSIPLDMLSRRTLNPDFFENPSFLIYADFVTDVLTGAGRGLTPTTFKGENQRQFAPFPLYVIGRVYSMLAGLLAVAAIFAAARRIKGRFAGIIAGLLAAVSLPLVQHAHYATTSSLAAGFSALTIWVALVFWQKRDRRWLVLAGITAGFATANRYNAGAVVLVVAGVGLLNLYQSRTRRALITLVAGVGASAMAFLVSNPYVIIHFPRFWHDIRYITTSYNIGTSSQFASPYGLLFEYRYLIIFGLGVPGAILALLGVWELRRHAFAIVILVYLAIYTAIVLHPVRISQSDQLLVPVLPAFVWLAAAGANWLYRRLGRRPLASVALALIVVVMPLALTLPLVRMLSLPDTRLIMDQWVNDHLPRGSVIQLNGSYNVPLDPVAYPWTQNYGGDLKPLADLRAAGVDYVILSDSWYHELDRSLEIVTPDYANQVHAYLAGYEALPLVAELPRPALIGSDQIVYTAAVWHDPGLKIYCLTPESCAAVR